jgi:outer membrane protein
MIMKMRLFMLSLLAATLCLCNAGVQADTPKAFEQNKPLRIAVVSFKTVVEKSKIGQKEQAAFDAMKKQMETILEGKEKALTEVASKFNDIDYLDSLSVEAEAELKRQFRTLNQEFNQQQNQFYQTLSQTNVLVIQKLTDAITKVSKKVAEANNIDLLLNEDSSFYIGPHLDISPLIVKALDEEFEKENKDAKAVAPAA